MDIHIFMCKYLYMCIYDDDDDDDDHDRRHYCTRVFGEGLCWMKLM